MELADVVKSLRLHWRVSVSCVLVAVVGLALFLVTRNQVQPANRYRVTIDVLVPAIDTKGNRPAGVPPSLLQGQSRAAFSAATEKSALDAAHVSHKDRHGITFNFSASSTSSTLTIGASARDPAIAVSVAKAFESAYEATRTATVAQGLKDGAATSKSAVARLTARLEQVRAQLHAVDPQLLASLPLTPSSPGANPVSRLSVETPLTTILLAVEHQSLLAQILTAENNYANDTTGALVAQSYAQVVEVNSPVQITPPLPSPVLPAAIFVAVGLILALAAPILIDRLDHSVRTAKSAAIAFDSIVLTSIPGASRRAQRALAPPGTPQDGAYRALAATSIATDRLPEAIVVTSPTGIMQDTVAANFAAALAGLGLRVVLVATDSRQSWFLDATDPEQAGVPFPDLLDLAHRGVLDGALPRGLLKTRLDRLLVLAPGPANTEVRLDGLRPLLEALSSSDVDVTVIAGPAVLEDPNATILTWTTRSVLWAFETGEVTEAEAKEAASRVALAGANAFGIAMISGKT